MELDPRKFKSLEDYESAVRYQNYMRKLRAEIEADPEVGVRLMQKAGIWDENGELTERFRDPES